jgi:hypothetical protein
MKKNWKRWINLKNHKAHKEPRQAETQQYQDGIKLLALFYDEY